MGTHDVHVWRGDIKGGILVAPSRSSCKKAMR